MGLLTGGAQKLFGEIFSPLYVAASIKIQTSAYDAQGKIRRSPVVRDCQVQVDRATEKMQAAEGFTITDRAIYVLVTSLSGEVDTDAELTVLEGPYAGARYKLAEPIERDPAAAYWLARGVKV